MPIHFLQNNEIDKPRWDAAIRSSTNSLIYAWSIYLDHLCPGWAALVNDDYSIVMPLTHKKKYGISYLYQPPFCQQLGLFGSSLITEKIVGGFITEARKQFSFAEIFLNHNNSFSIPSGFTTHKNYILDLHKIYDETKAGYTLSLIKKSLLRIQKFNLQYHIGNDVEKAILISQQLYCRRTPHVTDKDYKAFTALTKKLQASGHAFVRTVTMPNGELLACDLFLKDEKRIYYILSATLPNGRTFEANHFLLNELIKEFSGTGLILDFEGSDIPSIERFCQKFGAVTEPYYFLKWNELPWPARLLKK